MKALGLASAVALALAMLLAGEARAQCRGGGGGMTASATSGINSGGTSAASGQLLTGPGSWAHEMMLAQRMQLAYVQQQAATIAQKAAKQQAQKEKALAVARQRRESELYRRSQQILQAQVAVNR